MFLTGSETPDAGVIIILTLFVALPVLAFGVGVFAITKMTDSTWSAVVPGIFIIVGLGKDLAMVSPYWLQVYIIVLFAVGGWAGQVAAKRKRSISTNI